jgi:4-amino-4-deoxy-L-arabinose transferase-like glycosyltransferase
VPTPVDRRLLALVLLLGLLLRLTWSLLQPTSPDALNNLPDQLEYLSLGQNLLHHHTLVFHDPRFDQDVYAYRTPGYPLFIAALGGSPLAVRIAQAFIDTSTALAAYLIALRFLPARTALLTAALLALNPFLIYFSGLILSETLFTALLTWAVALLLSRPPLPLAGGLFLALAALVRPSGLLLPILLPAALAYLNPLPTPPYDSRRRWLPLATGVAATVLLFGLWTYRNHAVLGRWIWTTTNEGITQYDGFNPRATGSSDQRFVADMPQLREMTEVDRSLYFASLANQYTKEHPERVLTLAAAKLARTFSPVPLSDQFGRPLYRLVAAAYAVPVYALAVLGIIFPWASRRAKLFLLLPVLYFAAVHAFSVGSLRYRMPVEPFLAVLASAGLMCLTLSVNSRKNSRVA